MAIRLEYNGSVYNFVRDVYGVGNWNCVSGSAPGRFTSSYGIILHLGLQNELTRAAIKRGVATSKQLRRTQATEKRRVVKVSSRSKSKQRMSSSFNPFEKTKIWDSNEPTKVVSVKKQQSFFDSLFDSNK